MLHAQGRCSDGGLKEDLTAIRGGWGMVEDSSGVEPREGKEMSCCQLVWVQVDMG